MHGFAADSGSVEPGRPTYCGLLVCCEVFVVALLLLCYGAGPTETSRKSAFTVPIVLRIVLRLAFGAIC